MTKPKGRPRYKKYRRGRSGLKNFLILFCLLLAVIFIAGQCESGAEREYPRPDSYLVSYYCAEYGVETNLVYAIMKQESNFNPDAVSPKGARGLMQIMPSTAQWAAGVIGIEYDEDSLTEERYNLHLAIWYLSYLQEEFPGEETKVIAAYNGGDGNVNSWVSSGTWDGTLANANSIPFEETRNYVIRVSENLEKYREIYQ